MLKKHSQMIGIYIELMLIEHTNFTQIQICLFVCFNLIHLAKGKKIEGIYGKCILDRRIAGLVTEIEEKKRY